MDNVFPPYQNESPLEDTASVVTKEEEEEAARKTLSRKRVGILFLALSLIVLAFIVWEIIDISLGGRP